MPKSALIFFLFGLISISGLQAQQVLQDDEYSVTIKEREGLKFLEIEILKDGVKTVEIYKGFPETIKVAVYPVIKRIAETEALGNNNYILVLKSPEGKTIGMKTIEIK